MAESSTDRYVRELAGAVRGHGLSVDVVKGSPVSLLVMNTATGPKVSNPLYPSSPLSQRVEIGPRPATGSATPEREPIAPAADVALVAERVARVLATVPAGV